MRKKIKRNFLYLFPVLIIFSIGILVTSTRRFIPQVGCSVGAFTEEYNPTATIGVFEGKRVLIPPGLVKEDGVGKQVLADTASNNRWVEITLSNQSLKAWDGSQLFLETLLSSGLPWFPTPTGEFRIWLKVRYVRMVGGSGAYAYDLPNVPFVMFFENGQVPGYKGYSLHGTYWHNDFGRVHSHGCVNLPTPAAEKLYYWADLGTKVIIHD